MEGLNKSAVQLLCSSTKIVVATSAALDDSEREQIQSRSGRSLSPVSMDSTSDDQESLTSSERHCKSTLVKSRSLDFSSSFGIIDSLMLGGSSDNFLSPGSHMTGHSASETNLADRATTPTEGTWLRRTLKKRSLKRMESVEHPLHYPKTAQTLMKALSIPNVDPNSKNGDERSPIHAIVMTNRRKRPELLLTFLTHSKADVNLAMEDGNTGLHLAVMEKSEVLVKTFLGFGAELNLLNANNKTPLDIALSTNQERLIALFVSTGGSTGDLVSRQVNFDAKLPRLKSFHDTSLNKLSTIQRRARVIKKPNQVDRDLKQDEVDGSFPLIRRGCSFQSFEGVNLRDMEDGKTLVTLHDRLKHCINFKLEVSASFSANTDEDIAITLQQKELRKFNKTSVLTAKLCHFNVNGGSRILFLDGGGIRGLLQIEVLRKLERDTGRKVTELFDWIVGTSTGGIIALGLVYANKSLSELRKLYFKLKDQVFASDRLGFAYNTQALEELLKEEFGTEIAMNDVKFPRVLISAVYKKTTVPELHFFNNCFNDDLSTQLVWKVARYTSAAPMFFTEFENYVDGGVLANNPCDSGFSAIQNYCRQQEVKLKLALVVSVGSGIFPPEELGKVDAHKFLFFGKHWLKAGYLIKKRTKNLLALLTTALVDSESVAKSFNSRMVELEIPFYRFSPLLDEVIPSGETDAEKLLNMIIKARIDTSSSYMEDLVQMFYMIAEMNRT